MPDRQADRLHRWMELRLRPRLGERRLRKLLDRHGDPRAILGTLPADAERMRRAQAARRALLRVAQLGGRATAWDDSEYPERLLRLVDPPVVVFGLGRWELLPLPSVTIVGSRSATEYGRRVAARLAGALSRQGLVVTSGLARGIDSAAHRGALDAEGATIAVVGGGLGVPPTGRRPLFREIAQRGLVISEFLPDEHPRPHHFPKRNRILAALSSAVVVVEAAERSGAHITVRHALDVGATVWAVPGPIGRATSAGALRLIEDGARVVVDIEEAAGQIADEIRTETGTARSRSGDRPVPQRPSATRDPVLAAVGSEPTSLEEVIRTTGLEVAEVSRSMLRLELQGRITQLPGHHFVRAGS